MGRHVQTLKYQLEQGNSKSLEFQLLEWSKLVRIAYQHDGYYGLAAAVLEKAIEDLVFHIYSPKTSTKYISRNAAKHDAIVWFRTKPKRHDIFEPFAFQTICQFLNIDAERLLDLLSSNGWLTLDERVKGDVKRATTLAARLHRIHQTPRKP